MRARPAAVAGMFYPADPATLGRAVADLLATAPASDDGAKAIIAPHAGYQYSGPTAACAYRLLEGRRERRLRWFAFIPRRVMRIERLGAVEEREVAERAGSDGADRGAVTAERRAPTIMKIGEQWGVFSLKERSEPELDKHIDRALTEAEQAARSEFFGSAPPALPR